jgi:cytochrome P450
MVVFRRSAKDEAVRQMVVPGWWLRRRPASSRVTNARKTIDDYLEDCIAARQLNSAGQSQHDSISDLLSILIEAEGKGEISRDEVKGQLLQFVFAGFDTLAPTLTYMLWEVSSQNMCIFA